MTCGGSIGNAGKYLEKLCAEKKMNYRGCIEDYDARKLYRSVHHADSRGGGGNHPAGGNRHRRRRTLHQK